MIQPDPQAPARQERSTQYALYKPNARGAGGAVRFELNRTRRLFFVEAASQTGERQFDWEQKIVMKWGLADLGAVLAVLEGRQPQAKLFHQTEKGSSAFELTAQEDPARAPHLLQISRQEALTKAVHKVAIPVSHGEAAILETALKTAVARLLSW